MDSTQLNQILPACDDSDVWAPLLTEEFEKYGFTLDQQASFIAQTGHESMSFNALQENLNYSAERLMVIFPKYFRGIDNSSYHRNPSKIANRVYANRMGNGDEASGDGYKFRGRGILQVTGKNNYRACSNFLFQDDFLIVDPDALLVKRNAVGSAMWFWNVNGLLNVSDFTKMTRIINGGTHGLQERIAIYNRAVSVLL